MKCICATALIVFLVGCGPRIVGAVRFDGSQATQAEIEQAATICQGEVSVYGTTGPRPINGFEIGARQGAARDLAASCMARQGFRLIWQ
jgi:hypothetical protein